MNGLEIGDIDKIWYEFDELETELLTADADADSEAPAAEDEEAKPNPDTGQIKSDQYQPDPGREADAYRPVSLARDMALTDTGLDR